MRALPVLVSVLALGLPALAPGQSLVVHGSGGPTLVDRGYSLATGLGWAPWSRLTRAVNVERPHLFSVSWRF